MSTEDPELSAMASVLTALASLEAAAQLRVLTWVSSKLQLRKPGDETQGDAPPVSTTELRRREGTINMVCARLGVKSCRDLFIAAGVHLALYDGQERFTRFEWVNRAKESKSWKNDYSVQMSTAISRLMNSGFVNETAREQYAIPDEQLRQFESKL